MICQIYLTLNLKIHLKLIESGGDEKDDDKKKKDNEKNNEEK